VASWCFVTWTTSTQVCTFVFVFLFVVVVVVVVVFQFFSLFYFVCVLRFFFVFCRGCCVSSFMFVLFFFRVINTDAIYPGKYTYDDAMTPAQVCIVYVGVCEWLFVCVRVCVCFFLRV